MTPATSILFRAVGPLSVRRSAHHPAVAASESVKTRSESASWAEAACVLAGSLTPLLFQPFGTLAFEATKATLIWLLGLLLVLGWCADRVGWSRLPLARADLAGLSAPARWVALATLGYVGSQAVSTALSIAPSSSLWGSYDRLQGFVTLLAWVTLGVAAAVAGRANRRRLVDAWLFASIPVCVYGVAQHAYLDPIDWLSRPLGVTSTLGSSTALGGYLAMLIPLTIVRVVVAARALRACRPSQRRGGRLGRPKLPSPSLVYAGWIALLALQGVVLLMAQVRGAILGLVLGVGVTAVGVAWRYRRPWLLAGLAATVLTVAGGVLLNVGARAQPLTLQQDEVGARDAEPIAWTDDSSVRQRLLIWQATLATLSGAGWRSWVGFGPETQVLALEARFPVELANRYPDSRFDRAHNLVFDHLLTSGVFGVTALVAVLATLLHAAMARWGDGRPDEPLLTAGLLGALAGNLGSTLYAFDSITTGTLFWLTAGLVVAPGVVAERPNWTIQAAMSGKRDAGRRPPDPAPPRFRVTVALAALALGAAVTPWVVAPMVADLYHTRALALRAGEAPAASVAPELSAVEWTSRHDVYLLALGETYLELARTTAAREAVSPSTFGDLATAMPTGRDGLFAAARLAFERAAETNPLDPYSHVHLGRSAMLRSEATRDPSERTQSLRAALQAYDLAAALGPHRASFYDEAGLAATLLGQSDVAIERYRQAAALDRLTSERLARIGDAEVARGDPAAARGRYEEALGLDPRSAAAEHGLALLDSAASDAVSALEHAQRAARFQMRNWVYRRDLAFAYQAVGQWPAALVEARSARRLAPAWEWDDLDTLIESARERSR